MSYPFDVNGETVWDAGYLTGRMYASLAHGAAEALNLKTGLTANRQGGCDVEPSIFRSFVEGLYNAYSSTKNPVLHGITRSLLTCSTILAERVGFQIAMTPEHEDAFQAERADFTRAMS